jgi:pimeloyl-ACP methyl ester carboxylesterase
MTDTHATAPTRFVRVDGDNLRLSPLGQRHPGQPPLFFLQHFSGGMDHWDPLMTDGLAAGREVILYNGRGVASSSGKPRTRIEHMADDAAAVIRASACARSTCWVLARRLSGAGPRRGATPTWCAS